MKAKWFAMVSNIISQKGTTKKSKLGQGIQNNTSETTCVE